MMQKSKDGRFRTISCPERLLLLLLLSRKHRPTHQQVRSTQEKTSSSPTKQTLSLSPSKEDQTARSSSIPRHTNQTRSAIWCSKTSISRSPPNCPRTALPCTVWERTRSRTGSSSGPTSRTLCTPPIYRRLI